MAKRYIRINWQDKPSTATPLSAEFLNKMDKGIDDCDNAIETLDENKINKANIANNLVTTAEGLILDARQGKVLKELIDEQNNNLGNILGYLSTKTYNTDSLTKEQIVSNMIQEFYNSDSSALIFNIFDSSMVIMPESGNYGILGLRLIDNSQLVFLAINHWNGNLFTATSDGASLSAWTAK